MAAKYFCVTMQGTLSRPGNSEFVLARPTLSALVQHVNDGKTFLSGMRKDSLTLAADRR